MLIIFRRLVDFEIQLLDNNSVLRIYRAHLEKGGAFHCVVENSEGIAVANFLIVQLESVKGKTTVIIHIFEIDTNIYREFIQSRNCLQFI